MLIKAATGQSYNDYAIMGSYTRLYPHVRLTKASDGTWLIGRMLHVLPDWIHDHYRFREATLLEILLITGYSVGQIERVMDGETFDTAS